MAHPKVGQAGLAGWRCCAHTLKISTESILGLQTFWDGVSASTARRHGEVRLLLLRDVFVHLPGCRGLDLVLLGLAQLRWRRVRSSVHSTSHSSRTESDSAIYNAIHGTVRIEAAGKLHSRIARRGNGELVFLSSNYFLHLKGQNCARTRR